MSRGWVVVVVAGLWTSTAVGHASADVGGGIDGNSVKAHAEQSSSANVVDTDAPARGPRCSWQLATWLTQGDDDGRSRDMGPHYRNAETGEHATEPGAGVVAMYYVQCPYGTGPGSYRWAELADFIDRQAVIDAAYDEAVASVPVPSLNISPSPDAGVPAQLGIWLAVDDPGQVNAFAEVGPVWASVTARFTGMKWEMGNGDVVECSGLGTPYPEGSGTYEQGPCGYTYSRLGDAGSRHVRAVGQWQVQLVTSDGVDQALDPIERSFEFDYDVYEIVTVVEG